MSKAQASLEALIVIMLMLVFITIIISVDGINPKQHFDNLMQIKAQLNANRCAVIINGSFLNGIDLPQSIYKLKCRAQPGPNSSNEIIGFSGKHEVTKRILIACREEISVSGKTILCR